jgi:2-hydroxychromene-2-carboxylate isomerase
MSATPSSEQRPAPVEVLHYTDPACPWAYSAEPFLRALEWRYGDGLRFRHVMIGLSEDVSGLERRGVTPQSRMQGWAMFARRFGMPFTDQPRSRLIASGRACRAVKAAALQGEELSTRLLRALRLAWFTTTELLDEDEALVRVARTVSGLDADALGRALDDPSVEAAYQRDREEARSAATSGRPAVAQGKTADAGEGQRFTAPSLVFRCDGRALVAGGWQPLAAYDLCVANLSPALPQAGPATPADLLARFPDGLVTEEVARACCERNDELDHAAATAELERLVEAGEAERVPLGNDALWRARRA